MTHEPHLRAGNASRLDHAALDQLSTNDSERLGIVRGRAEKWIGGLTGLTGLLGTVLLLKGPEHAAEFPLGWRIGMTILVALALALLAGATFNAYRSAYGDPGKLEEVDPNPLEGLNERVTSKRLDVAKRSQQRLRCAVILTFFGIATIAAASGITWLVQPAEMGDSHEGNTCITVDGETIAKVAAETLPIISFESGVALSPCE